MENVIIVILIVAVAALGIPYTLKHFKGNGGCCSGGDYKPRKKHKGKVIRTRDFTVEGMHCNACKGRVEETVNDIDGAAGRVDLKKKTLTVYYSKEMSDSIIIEKLERLGYKAE